MREWLSGRASPCQGERREFESRLPLQNLITLMLYLAYCIEEWHHSQVVRQSSAKASPPVQIWVVPPKKALANQSKSNFYIIVHAAVVE